MLTRRLVPIHVAGPAGWPASLKQVELRLR